METVKRSWGPSQGAVAPLLAFVFFSLIVLSGQARADRDCFGDDDPQRHWVGGENDPEVKEVHRVALEKCGDDRKCHLDQLATIADRSRQSMTYAFQESNPAFRGEMVDHCNCATGGSRVIRDTGCAISYADELGRRVKQLDGSDDDTDTKLKSLESLAPKLTARIRTKCSQSDAKERADCADAEISELGTECRLSASHMRHALREMRAWSVALTECDQRAAGNKGCSKEKGIADALVPNSGDVKFAPGSAPLAEEIPTPQTASGNGKIYGTDAVSTHGFEPAGLLEEQAASDARAARMGSFSGRDLTSRLGCPAGRIKPESLDGMSVCFSDRHVADIEISGLGGLSAYAQSTLLDDLAAFAIQKTWQSFAVSLMGDPEFGMRGSCPSRKFVAASTEGQIGASGYMMNGEDPAQVLSGTRACFKQLDLGDRVTDLSQTLTRMRCDRGTGKSGAGKKAVTGAAASCSADPSQSDDQGQSDLRRRELLERRAKMLKTLKEREADMRAGTFQIAGHQINCPGNTWHDRCSELFDQMESCDGKTDVLQGCFPPSALNQDNQAAWVAYSNLKRTRNEIFTASPELGVELGDDVVNGQAVFRPAWEVLDRRIYQARDSKGMCPDSWSGSGQIECWKLTDHYYGMAARFSRQQKIAAIQDACADPRDYARKLLLGNPDLVREFAASHGGTGINTLICLAMSDAREKARSDAKWKAAANLAIATAAVVAAIPTEGESVALAAIMTASEVASGVGGVAMTLGDLNTAYENARAKVHQHHGCLAEYNQMVKANEDLDDAIRMAEISTGLSLGTAATLSVTQKLFELRRIAQTARALENGALPDFIVGIDALETGVSTASKAERAAVAADYGLPENHPQLGTIQELESLGIPKDRIAAWVKAGKTREQMFAEIRGDNIPAADLADVPAPPPQGSSPGPTPPLRITSSSDDVPPFRLERPIGGTPLGAEEMPAFRKRFPDTLDQYNSALPKGHTAITDDTVVWRYATDETGLGGEGLTFWQTNEPNAGHANRYLVKTTVGELKRQGVEIRMDPAEFAQTDGSVSIAVANRQPWARVPGVRRRVVGFDSTTGSVPVFEGGLNLDGSPVSFSWRDAQTHSMHFPSEEGAGAGTLVPPLKNSYTSSGSAPRIPGGGKIASFEEVPGAGKQGLSFHGKPIWEAWDGASPKGRKVLRTIGFEKKGSTVSAPDAQAAEAGLTALRADPALRGKLNSRMNYVSVDGKGKSIATDVYLEHYARGEIVIDSDALLLHDQAHGLGFLAMPDAAFARSTTRASLLVGLKKTFIGAGLKDEKFGEVVDKLIAAEVDVIDRKSMSLARAVSRGDAHDAREALATLTAGTDSIYDKLIFGINEAKLPKDQLDQARALLDKMRLSSRPGVKGTGPASATDLDAWTRSALDAYGLKSPAQ